MIRLAPILPLRLPSRTSRRGPSRTHTRDRARRAVRATGIAFLFLLPLVWLGTETSRPYFLDPFYSHTRAALATLRARHPGHRLAVLIGSSRTQMGFAPEVLEPQTDADGRPVLWFNVSHYEAGPAMNYVALRRLLRDEVKPDVVVVELMPAFCVRAEAEHLAHHTTWHDAGACLSATPPGEWAFAAVKRRVLRIRDLGAGLSGTAPYTVATPGPLGGGPYPYPVDEAERDRKTAEQLAWLGGYMQFPAVHPGTERATQALIQLCQRRGIELVFLRAPESAAFRSAYPPEGISRFDAWLDGWVREYGVRVIDARAWLPDDGFVDGHHATASGAATFTARLVRELGPVR